MREHLDQYQIERYVLIGNEIDPLEREEIESHLRECTSCREQRDEILSFYYHLKDKLESPPTERDRTFAEHIFRPRRKALPVRALEKQSSTDVARGAIDAYAEVIEPYRRPIVQRFVRYIRFHPLQFAGATSLAAALLVLGILNLQTMIKDKNPAYARAKEEFLVAYNKEGHELWRKHVGTRYDAEYLEWNYKVGSDDYLNTIDVDGDGRKEIIALFSLANVEKRSILCYTHDGRERWAYSFHRNMRFGTESFVDNFLPRQISTVDFDDDGSYEVLAVLSHRLYYPNAVIMLDAKTGAFLSEYWSPGTIRSVDIYDVERDGIKDVFVSGQNNGYGCATVAVLDPRVMSGHAPAPPSHMPSDVAQATEKFYVRFPQSDLNKFVKQKSNYASRARFEPDGTLYVEVSESHENSEYSLLYYFDSTMQCARVVATDPFVKLHKQLEAEGKLTKPVDAQYLEELRRGVQYWDGEKFVSEPVMNKRYLEAMKERLASK